MMKWVADRSNQKLQIDRTRKTQIRVFVGNRRIGIRDERIGWCSGFAISERITITVNRSKRSLRMEPNSGRNHRNEQQIKCKKKITAHDAFSAKNSGVDARAHKDKLELKAVKDGSASYAALEKKAALYEKLARGELSDEEDKEKYCVDFFVKRHEQDESEQTQRHDSSAVAPLEDQDGETDLSTLFSRKPVGLGHAGATWDNDEHKRFVREVHQEANQAREKASELKVRRQEQATARREKLKQAYIRKQLEKLKAAAPNKEQI